MNIMTLLTIYISDICNLKCKYCSASRWMNKTNNTSHLMCVENLLRYIKKYYPSTSTVIEFTGGGEPTMHPRFNWLLEQLNLLGYYVVIRTNGIITIPRMSNQKIVVTWHTKDVPDICNKTHVLIMRNPDEDWESKEKYCIDNNIPYELIRLKNYCRPKHMVARDMPTKSISFFSKWGVIFPNGVLSRCNKSNTVDEKNIKNMSTPVLKAPCTWCPSVINVEVLLSDCEKKMLRERTDSKVVI